MIKLRPDVRMGGMKPETVLAMMIASQWCESRGWDMWVFSIGEGVHSPGSLHYVGYAFDCWPDATYQDAWAFGKEIVDHLKALLGQDFDVVFERKPLHVHVEFQPKAPMNK